jgi:hypothetical protein
MRMRMMNLALCRQAPWSRTADGEPGTLLGCGRWKCWPRALNLDSILPPALYRAPVEARLGGRGAEGMRMMNLAGCGALLEQKGLRSRNVD